jgi:hypothetical protein
MPRKFDRGQFPNLYPHITNKFWYVKIKYVFARTDANSRIFTLMYTLEEAASPEPPGRCQAASGKPAQSRSARRAAKKKARRVSAAGLFGLAEGEA